jgi:hypothetical protein
MFLKGQPESVTFQRTTPYWNKSTGSSMVEGGLKLPMGFPEFSLNSANAGTRTFSILSNSLQTRAVWSF